MRDRVAEAVEFFAPMMTKLETMTPEERLRFLEWIARVVVGFGVTDAALKQALKSRVRLYGERYGNVVCPVAYEFQHRCGSKTLEHRRCPRFATWEGPFPISRCDAHAADVPWVHGSMAKMVEASHAERFRQVNAVLWP